MNNLRLKIPLRLFMCAVVLSLLVSASLPSPVFASAVTYSVRFTASYVSGNTGTKNVYYILDSGSTQLLGTVSSSSSMDKTFNATFSDKVRVYVEISDDAIYNEHLYINTNLVSNGNVGNAGLTYTRNDSTPPAGKITSPIANATITKCPETIMANVTDDSSGVQWVVYNVKYDGTWHQIGTDDSSSGTKGWSVAWDCSNVADQVLVLSISAMDNVGNQADNLGGLMNVILAKGQTSTQLTSTAIPMPTSVTLPSQAPTQPQSSSTLSAATPQPSNTMAATQTPVVIIITATQMPTSASAKTPFCPAVFAPLFVGLGFVAWKKRPHHMDNHE
jgi:hypothetical protein